jgi:hypothetical protein
MAQPDRLALWGYSHAQRKPRVLETLTLWLPAPYSSAEYSKRGRPHTLTMPDATPLLCCQHGREPACSPPWHHNDSAFN